ncbi:hypothetical protein QFZ96_001726 [Paraburkholderia youngii]
MIVALRERGGRVAERRANSRQPLTLRHFIVLKNLQHVAELPDQTVDGLGVVDPILLQLRLRVRFLLAHDLDEDLGDVVEPLLKLCLDEQYGERVALVDFERPEFRDIKRTCLDDELLPLADRQPPGRFR